MVQFDESLYFYLLGVIPVLVLLFLMVQVWKRSKQREFANTPMLRRLAPEKSRFKGTLKLVVFLAGLAFLVLALANPKIGTKLETVKRRKRPGSSHNVSLIPTKTCEKMASIFTLSFLTVVLNFLTPKPETQFFL